MPAKDKERVQTIQRIDTTKLPDLLLRILVLVVRTGVDLLRPPKAGISVHRFPPVGHDPRTS